MKTATRKVFVMTDELREKTLLLQSRSKNRPLLKDCLRELECEGVCMYRCGEE